MIIRCSILGFVPGNEADLLLNSVSSGNWSRIILVLTPCTRKYREKHHFRPSDDATDDGKPHPEYALASLRSDTGVEISDHCASHRWQRQTDGWTEWMDRRGR